VREGRTSGTVTVLFTDLVGSTELMSRLGAEAFDKVRQAHFAALRQAIDRHGGEEIKNTGDGVMVVFGSVADAIRGAVAMQHATDRPARSGPSPLAIRIGLSVGDVTFEDGDVFGGPVVEAARLVATADPGKILTTGIARALAGGRVDVEFVDLGALDLKGLPHPIPACEVVWQPAASSIPMPALLTDMGRVFVGRDGQVERLSQLWKEAVAGELRVALLAGEPGVGKTRLAAELAGTAHSQGAVVLAGRCDEDLGVPYQPFVEALRHFVAHTSPDDLLEGLGRYGAELVRLVPELAERVTHLPAPLRSDPETERYRLFDAVAAWLAAASTDQPVLLVLDDLQWAAKPTLLLLRHVVRSPDPARLLVLGTYRDTELGHDHPLVELLADLRRQRGVERLSLAGLDSANVAAFMEQAAGHELAGEDLLLAEAIHAETEGNPFFVREVLRHLTETGALERLEGRWTTRLPVEEVGIPEGVREVVGRRLARLSTEANSVLRAAAVVGSSFELSVLQAVEDLAEEDIISALEEGTEARLVMEAPGTVGRYRFAHALVRDTLYGGLSAARRVILHRRVAEAIEVLHAGALDDHLPALAHHWARASAPAAETTRAVDYARRAGDRALVQFANDEAVAYYRQALELLDISGGDEAHKIDLLICLGEAQRRAGDPAHRRTLLDAADLARSRGDTEVLVRAALANSRGVAYSRIGELDHERIAVLEAALAAVGETDGAQRARLMANLAVELVFADNRDRRVALSDAALAAARASGDDAVLAHVLMARYYTILAPSTLPERLSNTGELVAVTERLGDPFLAAMACFQRVRTAVETADVDEADHYLRALEGHADELAQPFVQWIVQFCRTGRELLAGRFDTADHLAAAAFEIGQAAGQPDAPLCRALEQFQTRLEQRRLEEAQQTLAEVTPEAFRLPLIESLQAVLACELDRDEEARLLLDYLAADGFGEIPVNNLWLTTLANSAAACAHLRDSDRSHELYGLLSPYANQLPVAVLVASGSVALYLGMLATVLERGDEAEAHFQAAEATHQRIGAPVWLARTRLEWARMLLNRHGPGDAQRARELLGQALDVARQLGLANIERRAVQLLT
jgi:class 3 adenylate cyclase